MCGGPVIYLIPNDFQDIILSKTFAWHLNIDKCFFGFFFKLDPACQEIDTEHHCYTSLPSCPPTGLDSNVHEINTYMYIIIILSVLLAIAVLIFGVVLILKIIKTNKRGIKTTNNGYMYLWIYIKYVKQINFSFEKTKTCCILSLLKTKSAIY